MLPCSISGGPEVGERGQVGTTNYKSMTKASRPDAKLIVDANAGWTLDEAIGNLKWLERYKIEVIERDD